MNRGTRRSLTFMSTDLLSFSLLMILTATVFLVVQWTPNLTSPAQQMYHSYSLSTNFSVQTGLSLSQCPLQKVGAYSFSSRDTVDISHNQISWSLSYIPQSFKNHCSLYSFHDKIYRTQNTTISASLISTPRSKVMLHPPLPPHHFGHRIK